MPIRFFDLKPQVGKLGNPAWRNSTHREICRIAAHSAGRARIWAAGAFTLALTRMGNQAGPSAWLSPDLVTAHETDFLLETGPLPEGVVLVPDTDRPGEWRALNAPIPAGRIRWLGGSRQGCDNPAAFWSLA
ncbi:MAG TPA: hypothetical protein VNZ61_00305 [Roseomonas sp.]|nr:hypothetical protein [Roseomonas sp.]